MKARIKNLEVLSPAIKRITLEPAGGALFPAASAGAHILLEIPGPDRVWKNAYSLVSPPGARATYDIIVRRVEHSRGGSAWLHGHAAIGEVLETSPPVNLFPIEKTAQKHLLLSAGIGITPFLAYLPVLTATHRPFELHHCCKASEEAAFRALLPAAANITIHTSRNTLDLATLLAAQTLNTHVYICGPENFMDAALATTEKLGWPHAKIHTESFGGATGGAPFTVRLARSGLTLHVDEDSTLLETLEKAGLSPPYLCRGGACGECELPVLAGEPDHHDHFLSPEKRAAQKSIMACVSRAKTPELVLDF
jgi:ferredoxin-NADP reductase